MQDPGRRWNRGARWGCNEEPSADPDRDWADRACSPSEPRPRPRSQRAGRSAVRAKTAVAQPVAIIEMNWSFPHGSPLSKKTCTGVARVATCHEPSGYWVCLRNSIPRRITKSPEDSPESSSTYNAVAVA